MTKAFNQCYMFGTKTVTNRRMNQVGLKVIYGIRKNISQNLFQLLGLQNLNSTPYCLYLELKEIKEYQLKFLHKENIRINRQDIQKCVTKEKKKKKKRTTHEDINIITANEKKKPTRFNLTN